MKIQNFYLSATILIFISGFLLFSCNQTPTQERTVSNNTTQSAPVAQNEIPNMAITTLDGKNIMIKKHQGKMILVLFQPDCDDCQREAVQIRDNMEAFSEYSIYFISSASMPEIASFSNDYNLNAFENITFAQTTVQNVINTLGPIPAPSVYIYSNEGKLVKSFNGEVDIKEIKAFL